jgi:hypothetical protein
MLFAGVLSATKSLLSVIDPVVAVIAAIPAMLMP